MTSDRQYASTRGFCTTTPVHPLHVYIMDANGNKYSPYGSLEGYVLPAVNENNKFINWQVIDTNVKIKEEFARVHLGIEGKGKEEKSAFDILKEAHLIGGALNKDDYITPASLIRILSLR